MGTWYKLLRRPNCNVMLMKTCILLMKIAGDKDLKNLKILNFEKSTRNFHYKNLVQNDDHRVDTFPIVVPISTSEVQEMISAIVCSLYASFSFLHFLPPGKTRGRSIGASPPNDCLALFCFSLRSIITFIFNSSWWLCLPPYVFAWIYLNIDKESSIRS